MGFLTSSCFPFLALVYGFSRVPVKLNRGIFVSLVRVRSHWGPLMVGIAFPQISHRDCPRCSRQQASQRQTLRCSFLLYHILSGMSDVSSAPSTWSKLCGTPGGSHPTPRRAAPHNAVAHCRRAGESILVSQDNPPNLILLLPCSLGCTTHATKSEAPQTCVRCQ